MCLFVNETELFFVNLLHLQHPEGRRERPICHDGPFSEGSWGESVPFGLTPQKR